MENKLEKVYIAIWVILFLIIGFLVIKQIISDRKIRNRDSYIERLEKELYYYRNLDSIYIVKRDSIIYNITYKDSLIVKIKEEYEKEKDKIILSSDDELVSKFNELVWSD